MHTKRKARYNLDVLNAELVLTISADNAVEVDIQSVFHELVGYFMGFVRELELQFDDSLTGQETLSYSYEGMGDGFRYVWAFDIHKLPDSMNNSEIRDKARDLIAYRLNSLFTRYVIRPVLT